MRRSIEARDTLSSMKGNDKARRRGQSRSRPTSGREKKKRERDMEEGARSLANTHGRTVR